MSQSALGFSPAPDSTPSTFTFGTHAVRVVMIDGEPWFVCTDVADALGYLTAKDAARHLDDDEKGRHIVPTLGGDQRVTIINESGLYALVLRSRKPEARKFAKWVTGEVLPSIRKTGGYATNERIQYAHRLATAAAAGVTNAVFDAVMAGGKLELDSWVLRLDRTPDGSPRPYVTLHDIGTLHTTIPSLIKGMGENGELGACFTTEQLAALAEGCAVRIKRRAMADARRKAAKAIQFNPADKGASQC